MKKGIIVSEKVYKPTGPSAHAQAVKVGNMVYVSGQVGWDKDMNLADGIDAQIEQLFKNMKNVLEAAGSSLENVVKVTHYTSNPEHIRKVREARTRYLGKDVASTGVIVKRLGGAESEFLVEIDAIAVID